MNMQLDGKYIRTYKKYIKMQVSKLKLAKLNGGFAGMKVKNASSISTLEMVLWGLHIPYTVSDGRIYATIKDNTEDITNYSTSELKAFFGRVLES